MNQELALWFELRDTQHCRVPDDIPATIATELGDLLLGDQQITFCMGVPF